MIFYLKCKNTLKHCSSNLSTFSLEKMSVLLKKQNQFVHIFFLNMSLWFYCAQPVPITMHKKIHPNNLSSNTFYKYICLFYVVRVTK